jgi:NAD(P)-dependent dehydrogenase (short-subunit alcohol dehydrogenase family)
MCHGLILMPDESIDLSLEIAALHPDEVPFGGRALNDGVHVAALIDPRHFMPRRKGVLRRVALGPQFANGADDAARVEAMVDQRAPRDGGHGDRCSSLAADVTDGESARRAVAAFGDVDVLATFAAVSIGGALHETSEETWRHVLEVNLMGTVRWVEAVLPAM